MHFASCLFPAYAWILAFFFEVAIGAFYVGFLSEATESIGSR